MILFLQCEIEREGGEKGEIKYWGGEQEEIKYIILYNIGTLSS